MSRTCPDSNSPKTAESSSEIFRLQPRHFWARGYFVSTVGRDEAVIREYIRNQEKEDERMDQLKLDY